MSDNAMAELRRWAILKALDATGNGSMSDLFLQAALERVGMPVDLHVIHRDLDWLEGVDMLAVSDMAVGMKLAVLRHDGAAVARGKLVVSGIAKPPRPA